MKKYLSGFKLNCLKQTSLSRERFNNNPSMETFANNYRMTNKMLPHTPVIGKARRCLLQCVQQIHRWNAAHKAAGKNDSKKDESKEKAVKTAEGADEASKNNSTPIDKRKGSEVITPSGLTPQNKTMNTGMFIFNSNIQISHKFVGHNNSTDHGKAVF